MKQSVGAQFKNQLNNLLGAIGETHPHYVRCLKPNDENVRSDFNLGRITAQLANGGKRVGGTICDRFFAALRGFTGSGFNRPDLQG